MANAPAQVELYIKLNGGAPQTGIVPAAFSDSAVLSVGGYVAKRAKYRIRAYPPGYACPAGWTTEGKFYVATKANAADSPAIALPTALSALWGKFIFDVIVDDQIYNGRKGVAELYAKARCRIPSTTGVGTVAYGEEDEFDATHGYVKSLDELARRYDEGLPGAGSVNPTGSFTSGNLLASSGTSGNQIQDSGKSAASVVLGPASAVSGRIPTLDGTGKVLADGGVSVADIGQSFNIRKYGAVPGLGGSSSTNVTAIQDAIDAADAAGDGDVIFPGSSGTVYNINAGFTIPGSHVRIKAPGGAKLRLTAAVPVVFAVGDIETGINLSQANMLASDAATGSRTIVLDAGKGANITPNTWCVLYSDEVIPDHHSAVVNKRAEFVRVLEVSVDTLTLDRPLRFSYTAATDAEICNVDWIEGFEFEGLGIDGNNHQTCAQFLQLSWCMKPKVTRVRITDLEQKGVRLQGCLHALIDDLRQENGLSQGFNGVVAAVNAYMIIEAALCEGTQARGLFADACRHGYTTAAGVVTNAGVTSTLFKGTDNSDKGLGVPLDSVIGPGTACNARGAGWDTHEVGMGLTFIECKTLGGLQLGFQDRCVRTRWIDCFARDCIGAVMQLGADSVDPELLNLRFERTNLGTDSATSTDWTKQSPITGDKPTARLGHAPRNEIDNGAFDLWDRGTSFSATGGTANRWKLTLGTGAAVTVTRRDSDTATRPHAGRYYLRFSRGTTGSAASTLSHYIDNVRSFAGRRVVLSFDARDGVDGTDVQFFLRQHFGTGGTPSADADTTAQVRRIDGTWRRYHVIFDVPALTGKTVGSDETSSLQLIISFPTAAGATLWDFDNVDLYISDVPKSFSPTPLAETRDRCARWFETSNVDGQAPGSATSQGNVIASSAAAPGGHAQAWGRVVHMAARKGRVPTITVYAPGSGTAAKLRKNSASDIDATIANVGQSSFYVRPTNSADVAANDVVACSWTAAVADFE